MGKPLAVERALESIDQFRAPRQPAPVKVFNLLPIDQILDRKPADWLIKNLLPRYGIAAIYGPSGSGKSFIAMDMLGAIVQQNAWFGHRTRPAPAVYICLEGVSGLAQRVKAYNAEIGTLTGIHVLETQFNLVNVIDEAALVKCIDDLGLSGSVIVLDTLAQATAGLDENSGEDMTRIIAACQRLQEATGGLVVLIHHTGKDSSKGLRGHSALIGALDAALEVSGGQDGAPRQWIARKVKDAEAGASHSFDLRRVVLGIDEDGDEISSCVVDINETAGQAVGRVRLPKGGNQKIIWDALGVLFRESGSFPPPGAPAELPIGRPCLSLADAISKTRDRLLCDADQKTYRTKKAVEGLIASGSLGHLNGFIWCK